MLYGTQNKDSLSVLNREESEVAEVSLDNDGTTAAGVGATAAAGKDVDAGRVLSQGQ